MDRMITLQVILSPRRNQVEKIAQVRGSTDHFIYLLDLFILYTGKPFGRYRIKEISRGLIRKSRNTTMNKIEEERNIAKIENK